MENNIQVRHQCLKNVPNMVIKQKNKILVQELNEIEVHKVGFDLPKHKALGVDGIRTEFFHELQPKVNENMTNLLQETFQDGSMNKELQYGLQIFIPKLGDWRFFTNYRPIFMLGFTYKITPKTLTNRL